MVFQKSRMKDKRYYFFRLQRSRTLPGMKAHAYNPSTLDTEAGGSLQAQKQLVVHRSSRKPGEAT